jgi:dTDP-4-dehydrorhamnose reductase
MRVLVLGAKGMLGTDLLEVWKSDEVIPADTAEADIRNAKEVRSLVAGARADWIVLAAAYTDVDGSEQNSDLAFAVNATGAENVARAASEFGARLFYISTDYVFDGNSTVPYGPTDAVRPLNVYGASKAAGEKAVQCYAREWCIGRTSWLFGAHALSFPEKILKASESRSELMVVDDQVGSPTFTKDLAGAMLQLLHADVRGFIHVTNAGTCSWFEFAQEVLRQGGRTSVRVIPVSSAAYPRPARRPAYSVLSPGGLSEFGITMRNWKAAIPDYLMDLRKAGKLKEGQKVSLSNRRSDDLKSGR